MKRGTKEFYEVKSQFEKAFDAGVFGYISGTLEVDNSYSHTFFVCVDRGAGSEIVN